MTSGNPTALFVGLPNAGKSNYLFRLWSAIRANQDPVFKRRGLPASAEYLNEGARTQLSGQFARHTPIEVNERPLLPVLVNGVPADLVVPDRPGEDWKRLYEERRFPIDWLDLLARDTGCLLFVPATGSTQPLDWLTIQRFRGPNANLRQQTVTDSDAASTQVILIDLIQLLDAQFRNLFGHGHRLRVAVVVTAWDALDNETQQLSPKEFLDAEFKLLSDFLRNQERIVSETFGLSLFGGDLKDETFREEYSADGAVHPNERGYVLHTLSGEATKVRELTLPVAWALNACS